MATLSGLREFLQLGGAVILTGYASAGDRGGGVMVWDSASTSAEYGSEIVRPLSVATGSPGRWVQASSGSLNVLRFGAKGDGVTDDTAAIQSAFVAGAALKRGVYFPAGTYLVGTVGSIGTELSTLAWTLYPGCTVSGDGMGVSVIKLANNSAGYRSIFNYSGTGSGITIRDLTFDQNATGNQSQVLWKFSQSGHHYLAVEIIGASSVTIQDCEFRDVFGMNAIVVGGNGKNVRVLGNEFSSNPIGTTYYDNSAAYLNCADQFVIGNHLTGRIAASGSMSVGGIEIHGGPSVVSANTISGFIHGMNIMNSQYVDDSLGDGISVTNNNFSGCTNGVVVWAIEGTTHRGGRISGNHMRLDPATARWTNIYGIGFVAGTYDDWEITDNKIWFSPASASAVLDAVAGIGYSQTYAATFSNFSIQDNRIANAPLKGISLNGDWSATEVSRNTITNAGCGVHATANFHSAIYGSGGAWAQVRIHDNDIVDTGAVGYPKATNETYLQPTSGELNEYIRNHVSSRNALGSQINQYVSQE